MLQNLTRIVVATGLLGLIVISAGCGKSGSARAADLINQGLAAQSAGRLDEAASDFQQAINADSGNKYAYYDYGVVAQQQGRMQNAEFAYRIALQKDPTFPQALYNVAVIRYAAGSTAEAIDLYRQAIVADPKFAAAYLNLGFALQSIGQTDEGSADINKAIALDPSLSSRAPQPTAPSGTPSGDATPSAGDLAAPATPIATP
jgi:tetratricopeptide (TPR) repeat protein